MRNNTEQLSQLPKSHSENIEGDDGFNEVLSIGDIAEVFDGPHATPKKLETGPYFLSISSLNKGALDLSQSAHISEQDFQKWTKRVTPQPGDVLFSYETRLGEAAIMPSGVRACLGRRMGLLRPDQTKVMPEYLLYAYLSPAFQNTIEQRKIHGATVDRIALRELPSFSIRIPGLAEQRAVVDNLKALDAKIQLNHQINQTLEQMAQAIFKSWFVDFEPVKAKIAAKESWQALQAEGEAESLPDLETCMNLAAMQVISGKTEAALNQMADQQPEQFSELFKTAALFPAAMQDSELGEIPEGWRIGAFKDLCLKVESGGTPKRSEANYWGDEIKWLSSGEVRDVIAFETKEKITQSGLNNSSAKLWPMYTTVVAMYGATAGQVCLLADEMTSNQACCGLIPKKHHRSFMFISARNSISSLADKASGSAQQNLNKALVSNHTSLLPPDSILMFYESLALPLLDAWIQNSLENKKLSEVRDALLPKLLSGELSVADLELEGEA